MQVKGTIELGDTTKGRRKGKEVGSPIQVMEGVPSNLVVTYYLLSRLIILRKWRLQEHSVYRLQRDTDEPSVGNLFVAMALFGGYFAIQVRSRREAGPSGKD